MSTTRDRLTTLTFGAAMVAAAALAGAVSTKSIGPPLLGLIVGVLALSALLRRFGVGCAIGLLVLGCIDALPGPNLELLGLGGSVKGTDVFVAGLVAVTLWVNGRNRFATLRRGRWGPMLAGWSIVFVVLWVAIVLRTWVDSDTPIIHGALYVRDFAFFALLVPLLCGALRTRRIRHAALVTLAIGTAVAGLAQSAEVLGHVPAGILVHVLVNKQNYGLQRLYTSAVDLPAAGLPLGLGACLIGRNAALRIGGAILAAICLLAVIAGLTRAIYLGETIGLAVALAAWLSRTGSTGRSARRRLVTGVAVVAVAVVAVIVISPPSTRSTAISGVSQRFQSLVTDLNGQASQDASIQTRQFEYSYSEQLLRGKWVLGLGDLPQKYHYVPGMFAGSIRNSDIGVFNVVITMGLLGAIVYLFPLLVVTAGLLRASIRPGASGPGRRGPSAARGEREWILFGTLAWCVAAIAVSPTLLWLFDPAQAICSAFVIGLAGAALVGPWPEEVARERPTGPPPLRLHGRPRIRILGRGPAPRFAPVDRASRL
jgi:hypothetical protein